MARLLLSCKPMMVPRVLSSAPLISFCMYGVKPPLPIDFVLPDGNKDVRKAPLICIEGACWAARVDAAPWSNREKLLLFSSNIANEKLRLSYCLTHLLCRHWQLAIVSCTKQQASFTWATAFDHRGNSLTGVIQTLNRSALTGWLVHRALRKGEGL